MIPPLPRIAVQAGPFDLTREYEALTAGQRRIGGIGSFIGVVRGESAGQSEQLQGMTLEHYPGMTEKQIRRIAEEAIRRWSLLGCTIIHRIGYLPAGAPIVLVMTAAPHREAALESTSFLIDWLKTKAPFWKQEHLEDGTIRWVAARDEDEIAADRWNILNAS
ncbi:Molybdopterin converting factor, large subunit [Granulibacter bethesdensis]|uniref:Molybdopterin synthase catalytic subunit n=1 Tax=Granulibacter bethesdensis TaxID=364410 RepID=A0AAC9KBK0_9PROT|nr:molybdenum cofactor biosynthesis protein MoaE [Granulibacter bethesdensis]APH55407.1 Molybdopterin converting factor, large subunit [Granulibacter bethesdensis]APH62993.1 Molybdopterin converting factor, large subunit [Granulibacter bethesdensis]